MFVFQEFTAISKKSELHNSDMPHKEERMALMQSILSRMEEQVGIKNRQITIEGNDKLVIHKGMYVIDSSNFIP